MNLFDLQQAVADAVALLKALDKIYPTKIDADLITLLENLQHPWQVEQLFNQMERQK